MTPKQKKRFFRLISNKKNVAHKRLDSRHAGLADLSVKNVGDIADEALRTDVLGLEYTLEEREILEYQDLEEAQARIESGMFGFCQVCGEPIEIERLLIVPETSMCLSCAEYNERNLQLSAVAQGGV